MKTTTTADASVFYWRLGAAIVCLLLSIGCTTLKPHMPEVGLLPPRPAPTLPPSEIALQAVVHMDIEQRGRDLPTYLTDTQRFEASTALGFVSIAGDATYQAWQQDNSLHVGINSEGLELGVRGERGAATRDRARVVEDPPSIVASRQVDGQGFSDLVRGRAAARASDVQRGRAVTGLARDVDLRPRRLVAIVRGPVVLAQVGRMAAREEGGEGWGRDGG